MEKYLPTTPFGRRDLCRGQIASLDLEDRRADASVHKWKVFRDACEARAALGLAERALTVLEALLSFHPEPVLSGKAVIVFPSNETLMLRAKGMPGSTLRRHLAGLIEAGLVIRRDSPNGKRYARRASGGEIDAAFGFDLSPLVARAGEIAAAAQAAREDRRVIDAARERVSICRRDIGKTLAAIAARTTETGVAAPAAAGELEMRFQAEVARIPRRRCRQTLEAVGTALTRIAGEAFALLRQMLQAEETGARGACSGRLIEGSKPESHLEDKKVFREGMNREPQDARVASSGSKGSYTLGQVLEACPDIVDYAKGGVAGWGDLVAAAALAAAVLGVSPSGWKEARASLGDCGASAVVAYMLQRGEKVANPGGYLRRLARKAAAGEMSVDALVAATLAARRRSSAAKPPALPVKLSAAALRIMGSGVGRAPVAATGVRGGGH